MEDLRRKSVRYRKFLLICSTSLNAVISPMIIGNYNWLLCRTPINAMALHPDEVFVALACWDSTIKVYNILNSKRLAVS